MSKVETRYYRGEKERSGQIQQALINYFNANDYEYQTFSTSANDWVVQARKEGYINTRTGKKLRGILNVIGMTKAISVKVTPINDDLSVEIGEAKWVDKAVVGVISVFILWPLLITAGIGAYQQSKLKNDLLGIIDHAINYY